ncbi:MAG: Asp-tRNA(Asn)/Glu-tRNA(Gln) amidotransferase subunit GatA [Sphingobacteriales bacterium]|nr:MAG: Asp-tRNA(Asn)/Glu-tRNA(Gln) amidotransferase subunit GatA [Sphingobacteriales bacterium]
MKKYATLQEVRSAIGRGEITLPQLLEDHFAVIKENEHLNVFNEVFFYSARIQAAAVQDKIKAGTAGKLAGMVIGIKDNILYRDHEVNASSAMLKGFVAPYSSTVVERLLSEDAVIIGRQNCDEFAMGGSNETSIYGPVKNFADPERVAGGSSGGSAVAVQSGMCLASLGTDTGGSVRQPAAFCGVIGVKPTYGRISRHGVIAYASSFDQVGTFTNSMEDAALLLHVLSGQDGKDSTLADHQSPKPEITEVVSSKRVAVIREMIDSDVLDPEIKKALLKSIEDLKTQGYLVEYVSFDLLDQLVPTYYILTTAEASSNLSRYDGIRYGHRTQDAHNLTTLYKRSRDEGFGEEVKRRILLGTFVLSAGYYDAYYQKAQRVRRMICDRLEEIFRSHDVILCPVTPTPAFKLNELMHDPLVMYMADIFTVLANLGGIPAIAIPAGNNAQGLPLSVQLMANRFNEGELFSTASAIANQDTFI